MPKYKMYVLILTVCITGQSMTRFATFGGIYIWENANSWIMECSSLSLYSQHTTPVNYDMDVRTHSSVRRFWFTCRAAASAEAPSLEILFPWRLQND